MEIRGSLPGFVAVPLLEGDVAAYYASAEAVEIRVEDKSAGWAHARDEGNPQVSFLVYTDRGVFQVGWEPLFLDFAAAERYHALKKGGSYRVLVAGWRLPFTNWYPSIVKLLD